MVTFHPYLPLTSPTSVLFCPQGNSLPFSGPRRFFYTYHLRQGTSQCTSEVYGVLEIYLMIQQSWASVGEREREKEEEQIEEALPLLPSHIRLFLPKRTPYSQWLGVGVLYTLSIEEWCWPSNRFVALYFWRWW